MALPGARLHGRHCPVFPAVAGIEVSGPVAALARPLGRPLAHAMRLDCLEQPDVDRRNRRRASGVPAAVARGHNTQPAGRSAGDGRR
jgi:hypothetical protein